ncbi:hypothetical protein [Yoonia sp. 2307UL14-13]|uniref:hypothetical protein n=1 Tax=Yoonia sp. 2307UL14-13 TaxID=3126506 RepID=UPI00309D8A65
MQECTVDEVLRTSNRLPFKDSDVDTVFLVMRKQNQRGLEVHFHPSFATAREQAVAGMKEGFFVLSCPQIQSDFIFVCENAGKGLFGRQKRSYRLFLGDIGKDNFSAVNSFRVFTIALTSINNVFRHEGWLKGAL